MDRGERRLRPRGGIAGELPKINDAVAGRRHRYGYFVTTRGLSPKTMSDGLAHHNHLLDSTTVVEEPDGLTSPSEPIFVSRQNARGEDAGYLLSIWWNPETALSGLLIHDAADLRRTPLARVELPSRVPSASNRELGRLHAVGQGDRGASDEESRRRGAARRRRDSASTRSGPCAAGAVRILPPHTAFRQRRRISAAESVRLNQ